jgi:hypothetical protein
MITPTTDPLHHTSQSTRTDQEAVLIASLHEAMIENGVSVGQAEIANFYVALKSKPLAILAGPAQSGKNALVQSLAQSLVDRESLRVQMFTGHPWWAERSDGIASHTELHARFSTEKMLSIIEEAGQPENTHQVFIACITRISPAELLSFFTEAAFQLQNGQIMRLGDTHLSEPILFPSNLRIIGTMDTLSFDWWDSDLLLSTTVIQWPRASVLPDPVFNRGVLLDEHEFLQSCILGRDAAYRKVFPVLKRQRQPLYPLLQVEAILKRHISSLHLAIDEVMIYLANSWSRSGNGLFHPSPDRNLAIALDLAIAQILLPRAADAIRNLETLRNRLKIILAGQFLRSDAFVTALADQD